MTMTKNSNAVIDANHAVYSKQRNEIELLRILLWDAKGWFISTQDTFTKIQICRDFPDLAIQYGVEVPNRL